MNKNWRCELAINGEVWDAELVYSRRERQRKLPHREDEGMEERGVRQQRVWTDPVTYTLTTVSSGSRQVSHILLSLSVDRDMQCGIPGHLVFDRSL
jgi:hypothetical protein